MKRNTSDPSAQCSDGDLWTHEIADFGRAAVAMSAPVQIFSEMR
jgi:hypothetical protein